MRYFCDRVGTRLPNARLKSDAEIFAHFVGEELGKRIQQPLGELWLPVGVQVNPAQVWIDGEPITAGLEPDFRELLALQRQGHVIDEEELEKKRLEDSTPRSHRQRISRHAVAVKVRSTDQTAGDSDQTADDSDRIPMSWRRFHQLRLGIREIARRTDNASMPASVVAKLHSVKISLRSIWSEDLARQARADFQAGVGSDILFAARALNAFEEFDVLAGDERFFSEAHVEDLREVTDLRETYPFSATGRPSWVQRIVSWARQFGVNTPRDLAALAAIEPESVPKGYDVYRHEPKKARGLWKSASQALRRRWSSAEGTEP